MKKDLNLKITVSSEGKSDVIHRYQAEVHQDHLPKYIVDIGSDIITTITYMILEDEDYPTCKCGKRKKCNTWESYLEGS